MTEPSPPDEGTPESVSLSASVDEIERAIESALAKLETERKAEAAAALKAAAHKAAISRRVSIAALLLTMMLSFLGFVRAQSDSAESDAKLVVQQSRNDVATEWSLYQTKTSQRSGFIEAEDVLAREVLTLEARAYNAQKDVDHHDRRTKRYDMGIRTLTLALVLISVTLLVDRSFLFFVGLLIAAIGASLGVTGYFLR